jgi:hypothetical protein
MRHARTAAAVLAKWRLRCRPVAQGLDAAGERLLTFLRYPPEQWRSLRTTHAIERPREELKRRIETRCLLPCAETAAMLSWALPASGQITLRKLDGRQSLAQPPAAPDLAARAHQPWPAGTAPLDSHQPRDTTILDEPTAALGVKQASHVLRIVHEAKRRGLAVIFITHKVTHAMAVGDHFALLIRGALAANFLKGEKTREEITDLMAGGESMADLEATLEGYMESHEGHPPPVSHARAPGRA